MSSTLPVGARDLLRHGPFLYFLLSRSLSRFSSQIAAVAIGWQIYDLTGSAWNASTKSAPGALRSKGGTPPPM